MAGGAQVIRVVRGWYEGGTREPRRVVRGWVLRWYISGVGAVQGSTRVVHRWYEIEVADGTRVRCRVVRTVKVDPAALGDVNAVLPHRPFRERRNPPRRLLWEGGFFFLFFGSPNLVTAAAPLRTKRLKRAHQRPSNAIRVTRCSTVMAALAAARGAETEQR